jgi:predicted O-linked N-acetylglucosamine transferase (SPINDLY family)
VFDWTSYAKLLPGDFRQLRKKGIEANPWFFLSLIDDPEGHLYHQEQMQAARLRLLGLSAPRRAPRPKPHPDGKIRIGYYSSDFHNHATLKLMSGMLREHDRGAFEIHCFDFGKNDSVSTADMAHFDATHRVNFHSDAQITDLSRALGIDIAVDLKGETAGNRISLFLLGQAPVQINYLGYPGTLGTTAFDYIIGDPVLIPPEHEAHFSEKIMRLPTCYLPNDDRRRAGLPPTRTELGLPEDAIVLACLNDHYKISAEVFATWAEALQAAPDAVLWLLDASAEAKDNLLREAASAGIAPERIVFAARLEHQAHVTRLAQADLYLDTMNCTAHTLAADAVCGANLPLLTCAGRQFAARVGASFISAAGLPELVSDTLEAYRETLLRLVQDPGQLLELRGRLARNRATVPLFSSRSYARCLEQGYRTAHARSQAGQAAKSFDISLPTS